MEKNYGTVSETVNALRKEGYVHDFNIQGECLTCHELKTDLSPNDFEIDEVYRFEGQSNPDDEAVIYAISSKKYNIKGMLVNAYGIYSDDASNVLVKKLKTHK